MSETEIQANLWKVLNSVRGLVQFTSVGELLQYSVEGTETLMSYLSLPIGRSLVFQSLPESRWAYAPKA